MGDGVIHVMAFAGKNHGDDRDGNFTKVDGSL